LSLLQPTESDIEAAKEELVQDMLAKLEEVSRVAALAGLPSVLRFAAETFNQRGACMPLPALQQPV
jgi:hypothetical protein